MSLHDPPFPAPSSLIHVSPSPHFHLCFSFHHLSPFVSCSSISCFALPPSPLRSPPALHLPPHPTSSTSLCASSLFLIASVHLSPSPRFSSSSLSFLLASHYSFSACFSPFLLIRIRESGSCLMLLNMGLHCVSVCVFLFSLLRPIGS